MASWKMASACSVGRGHVKNSLPCQDKTHELPYKHSSGNFYGIALADGAGSCENSDKGAEFVLENVMDMLKSEYSPIFKKKNADSYILKHIEKSLHKFAEDNKVEFKSLSSTLLFVALKNNKYIIGHIGDGVIGMLNKDNEILTLSKPDNGEYANSTFFTTSTTYKNRLRLYKGEFDKAVGFILMSDGSEESLYDKSQEKLADINIQIINWLKDNSEEDVSVALKKNLETLIIPKTIDDCSIAIIRRNEE